MQMAMQYILLVDGGLDEGLMGGIPLKSSKFPFIRESEATKRLGGHHFYFLANGLLDS